MNEAEDSGAKWRAWLAVAVAKEEASLRREHERLVGIGEGRRFKPPVNMSWGWTDCVSAQVAYVDALQQWINYLREPDKWLLRFLKRPDFGGYEWQSNYGRRREQFIRKHAWEPSAEHERPRYAGKRRKAAERRRLEREQRTAPIDRRALYERDRGRCAVCGVLVPADDFHLDHIVPLSRGGAHGPENLRVTCEDCNVNLGNGYSTRRGVDWPWAGSGLPTPVSGVVDNVDGGVICDGDR